MAVGSSFVIDRNTLSKGLRSASPAISARIDAVMARGATQGQNYMRANAPWTDRTGNARNGLFGTNHHSGNQYVIVYFHSVPYGIWLEVAHSGRYRIIPPTLQVMGRDVMRMLNSLLKGA